MTRRKHTHTHPHPPARTKRSIEMLFETTSSTTVISPAAAFCNQPRCMVIVKDGQVAMLLCPARVRFRVSGLERVQGGPENTPLLRLRFAECAHCTPQMRQSASLECKAYRMLAGYTLGRMLCSHSLEFTDSPGFTGGFGIALGNEAAFSSCRRWWEAMTQTRSRTTLAKEAATELGKAQGGSHPPEHTGHGLLIVCGLGHIPSGWTMEGSSSPVVLPTTR